MTVVFKSKDLTFIDHAEYVNNLYKTVQVSETVSETFKLNPQLFCIKSDKKIHNRKRKHDGETLLEEVTEVKQMYENSSKQITEEIKAQVLKKYNLSDKGSVRDLSKYLFETTSFDHAGMSGGNNSETPLKANIKGDHFLIPQKSRFFCGCVKEQCLKLDSGCKFDILIADPPWWNKFIRRLKNANEQLSYKMMYNEDIASIPVKDHLAPNCLVAVWCTNSPSNIAAVKDLIFPAWGVTYVTTWYWMKVTIDMEPMYAFGTGHMKQPYERLILGKVGELSKDPEKHMFMSVPSALHSHKLPLLDLLSPFVPAENPHVLELFARYLLPRTTSIGHEPLKWQHLTLYEQYELSR
ncbi:MT-A70 domain-containing protein [Phthorimaea operculella]|nr:MT-A70 domain-containing protein [Phthorimaea operculella]